MTTMDRTKDNLQACIDMLRKLIWLRMKKGR